MHIEELTAGPSPADISAALDVLAIGWATVDLDRSAAAFAAGHGLCFSPGSDERLLGATVRRSAGRTPDLLLLEPNTEGRLARLLARHGEGPAAIYVQVSDPDRLVGLKLREGDGPLGPARLILGGQPAGPFLILVGNAPAGGERVPSSP